MERKNTTNNIVLSLSSKELLAVKDDTVLFELIMEVRVNCVRNRDGLDIHIPKGDDEVADRTARYLHNEGFEIR